jgi:hypothetical protein
MVKILNSNHDVIHVDTIPSITGASLSMDRPEDNNARVLGLFR